MKTDRRKALGLFSGFVLSAACSGADKGLDNDTFIVDDEDTGDDPQEPSSSPTSEPTTEPTSEPSGEPEPELVLADEGPELPDRFPRSLLDGDSTPSEFTLSVLSGTLPSDVSGYLYVAYPTPYDDDSAVVLGEGMILRLDLASHSLKTNILKPPCYYVDQATQGEDYSFYNAGLARVSFTLGARSLLNTAFLPMENRLLVTSDASRPWSIDAEDLTLNSPIGRLEEWYNGLPDVLTTFVDWPLPLTMSTAHPAYDSSTGELFTVNWGVNVGSVFDVGGLGFIHLLVWDGGEMRRFRLKTDWLHLDNVRIIQSVHQIAVTSDHVIIMDTAFVSEMEDLIGGAGMKKQKSESILWVVPRSELVGDDTTVQAKKLTIPREAAHFLADYDSSQGRITLHLGHQCANDSSEFLAEGDLLYNGSTCDPELHGMICATTDTGVLGKYIIDADSMTILESQLIQDERLMGGPSLYTFDGHHAPEEFDTIWWLSFGISPELRAQKTEAAYADYPYRHIPLSDLPTENVPPILCRVDVKTMSIEEDYSFPNGRFVSSPTFVPKTSGEDGEGYIYCIVVSDDDQTEGSSGDEIWIFDAQNLSQGPLCRLGHPSLNLPMTLHSLYLESLPSGDSYSVSIYDDYNTQIANLDSEIITVFENEVFTRFV
ncbi:MAG: hypothetical protein CL916_04855 [Deltaproteobacteria bacterium]|nr:hypothetical protein [Deltaproteobacteria bacterium]